MNIALWIGQGLLAVAYLAAGLQKVLSPREKLVTGGRLWAKDVSDRAVKGVGAVEVLGALGVVLPWLTGVFPILTPIAAAGLVVVQVVAARVQVKVGELKSLPVNIFLLLLALFVAVGRFAG